MNYDEEKSKMLTIIKTCKQWKYHLKNVVYSI